MPQILYGKPARDFYKQRLISRVTSLSQTPLLALIQIGDNKESSIYIEQKKKFAKVIGANVEHIHLPESSTEKEVAAKISALNARKDVQGIIVQLPLPSHLNKEKIYDFVDPKKDVDGLTSENQKLLEGGAPRFIPATAKGISLLLDFYKISVRDKKVAVLGRSRLVGHPTAELLKMKGGKVTVCHSQTTNTKEICTTADLIIVAIGKPMHVDSSYVKKGAVIIDVGINSPKGGKFEEEMPHRKVVGDVNFDDVSGLVEAITPVPGGVGPMTVLSLFDNLISSAEAKTL
jgi:methylenetetrahydrofolate dehydrogenase (NADP+)/methenyltetrahydrofolate cyclohydrolase